MARTTRALPLMLSVLLVLSGLTLTTDAKRHKHDKKPSRPPSVESAAVPWAGEEEVLVRYYGIDGPWAGHTQELVGHLNDVTQYMPNAPDWVFLDAPFQTCRQMDSNTKYGLTICTERAVDDYLPDTFCGAGVLAKKVQGKPDGWWARIYIQESLCNGSSTGVLLHEAGHFLFDMCYAYAGVGHCPESTTGGNRPWGLVDFERMEAMFGPSTVPFCEIYPNNRDC